MHAGIRLPATKQHDAPLLTVLYWQPTPTYVSWEVDGCDGHLKKRKDLMIYGTLTTISEAFCSAFSSYTA